MVLEAKVSPSGNSIQTKHCINLQVSAHMHMSNGISLMFQQQFYCVEPMMIGTYIKHNDNDGNIDSAEQVLPLELHVPVARILFKFHCAVLLCATD